MAAVEEIKVDGAHEFLDYLRPSQPHWLDRDTKNPGYYFRGHSSASFKLLPAQHRETDSSMIEIARRLRAKVSDMDEPTSALYAQKELANSFIAVARSVGLIAPARLSPNATIPEDIELIGLMQHYGAVTELLDWTRSPLIAATFAADEDGNDDICVWAASRHGFTADMSNCLPTFEQRPDVTVKFYDSPIHHNPFLRSQAGTFSFVDRSYELHLQFGRWISLEELHDYCAEASLKKVILARKHVKDLRDLLYREELSMAHLKPDYREILRVALNRCLQDV